MIEAKLIRHEMHLKKAVKSYDRASNRRLVE